MFTLFQAPYCLFSLPTRSVLWASTPTVRPHPFQNHTRFFQPRSIHHAVSFPRLRHDRDKIPQGFAQQLRCCDNEYDRDNYGNTGIGEEASSSFSYPTLTDENYNHDEDHDGGGGNCGTVKLVGFGLIIPEILAICKLMKENGIYSQMVVAPAWDEAWMKSRQMDQALDMNGMLSMEELQALAVESDKNLYAESLSNGLNSLYGERSCMLLILDEFLDPDIIDTLSMLIDECQQCRSCIVINPMFGEESSWLSSMPLKSSSFSSSSHLASSDLFCMRDIWDLLLKRHCEIYELNRQVTTSHDMNRAWDPSQVQVSLQLELDGAHVKSRSGKRWDASRLVVFDGMIDAKLQKDLLDLITEQDWDHSHGPPPSKWQQTLIDRIGADVSYGLTEDAIQALCELKCQDPSLIEVNTRLSQLYPDYTISFMAESVLGDQYSPLVANAPMSGERFSYHIDCDPLLVPGSPWRDVYGVYSNREPGKPLFVTMILYLMGDDVEEWPDEWEGETLFVDNPTDTGVFVKPKKYRAVLMDQDIRHRINGPSTLSGGRPRYSLVWKLVMHPKETALSNPTIIRQEWGPVTCFGSANRR